MRARLHPSAVAPIMHLAGGHIQTALEALLGKIITRSLRPLTRLGHLVDEESQTYLVGDIT